MHKWGSKGDRSKIVSFNVESRVESADAMLTLAIALATAEDVKATETESQKQRVNQTGKGFDESKIPILSLDHPTNNLVSWYRLVKAKGMGVSLNPAIEVME